MNHLDLCGFFSAASKQMGPKMGLAGKRFSCVTCGLSTHVLSPKMQPFGNFKKGILNIGEAPGEREDLNGKQWQGKMGRVLRQTYEGLGIDLFEDCININAINCRPTDKFGKNRPPTSHEISCCRSRVLEVIKQYQPKIIVVLGGSAIVSILGHRWKKDLGRISKWRGWTIPDRDFEAWVCPTFHPSYVDRQRKFTEVMTVWKQDLKQAFSVLEKPFPQYTDEKSCIDYVEDDKALVDLLSYLSLGGEGDLHCFDYETTGLKPHAAGHRIVCMAIATASTKCYVFMMPKKKMHRSAIADYLSSDIGKMAHNIKFEHTWSQIRLDVGVKSWEWDSMLAAHVLDNRPGITGLKFQTYMNFGVVDYDSNINPYIKGIDPKNANSKNKIFEFIAQYGKEGLLTYCGLDALFGRKLGVKQMEVLEYV